MKKDDISLTFEFAAKARRAHAIVHPDPTTEHGLASEVAMRHTLEGVLDGWVDTMLDTAKHLKEEFTADDAPSFMRHVVTCLADLGVEGTVEYPGYIQVWHSNGDDICNLGTANGHWQGDWIDRDENMISTFDVVHTKSGLKFYADYDNAVDIATAIKRHLRIADPHCTNCDGQGHSAEECEYPRAKGTDILADAAALLNAPPFRGSWIATVEYPGYLQVTIDNGDGTSRAYAAGFANPTLTVNTQHEDGSAERGVDTQVPCVELDGFRMAVHVAAAIDRLEH